MAQKKVPWMVGMKLLKVFTLLPAVVFLSSPSLVCVNQSKASVASKRYDMITTTSIQGVWKYIGEGSKRVERVNSWTSFLTSV
jgi:hypothetical protein